VLREARKIPKSHAPSRGGGGRAQRRRGKPALAPSGHLHLPPAAQHLPPCSASGRERQLEVTGSAYGLQPHRPVSDVLTVVPAAVVLSPPCGWQLAARISATNGALPLCGDHLRVIEAKPA